VSPVEIAVLAGMIFLAATLYSSVGHAGASGYLAAMALFGLAPEIMKPTALVLNILVATLTATVFYRAGLLDWRRLWPFLLGSIPLAFLGGAVRLPGAAYRIIVGVILILAAVRLVWGSDDGAVKAGHAPVPAAAVCGGGIGFLFWTHGYGRGDLPESAADLHAMGHHVPSVGHGCRVHPREFGCGARGPSYQGGACQQE
jgi:uncharacterized protein